MQADVKARCRHAYVEHIRGRLLHFKLHFDGGRGRSRRTIGTAALFYASVLPDVPPPGWPVGSRETTFPFSIPVYYGCAFLERFVTWFCLAVLPAEPLPGWQARRCSEFRSCCTATARSARVQPASEV
jgi:hypothetical protein